MDALVVERLVAARVSPSYVNPFAANVLTVKLLMDAVVVEILLFQMTSIVVELYCKTPLVVVVSYRIGAT